MSVTNINILIVDDEPQVRDILSRFVKHLCDNLYTAEDGQKGLEVLEKEKVDIILSDIKMPNMDGIAFFNQVLEKEYDVILMFITGFADLEKSREAMRKGAFDIIDKPFDDMLVENRVKNAINRLKMRRLEDEIFTNLTKCLNYDTKVDFHGLPDDKRIYFLDRRGRERIRPGKRIVVSKNNLLTLDMNIREERPRWVCSDSAGNVICIYQDGSVAQLLEQDLTSDHFFLMQDMDVDGIPEYIFTEGNELSVLNQDEIKLFSFRVSFDILP